MNYKFLNGARRAGVILALMLLGAGAALAAPVTVTVDLAKIKPGTPNTDTKPTTWTGTADATPVLVGEWGKGRTAASLTGVTDPEKNFIDGVASVSIDADGVIAMMNVKSVLTGGTGLELDSLLVIEAGTNVKQINVTGTLPTAFNQLKKITFKGGVTTDGMIVYWDGGSVTAPKRDNPVNDPTKYVKTFLNLDAAVSATNKIRIIGGTVNAWADYLITDVLTYKDPTVSQDKNEIGGTSTEARGKTISLVKNGERGAAVEVLDANNGGRWLTTLANRNISINPPNNGEYSIVSDGVAVAVAPYGTAADDNGLIVIGNTTAAGSGTLKITGWNGISTATASASAGAAVEANNVVVEGKELAAGAKGVVINSKGVNTLYAKTGRILAESAEIQHNAVLGAAGAVVFAANDTVDLKRVKVTGLSAGVAGSIVNTKKGVGIEGGTFAAANNIDGVAIATSGGIVKITGAKIWSAGAAGNAGAVVQAPQVHLVATATDSVVIESKCTVKDVAGISATGTFSGETGPKVTATVNGAFPAIIRTALGGTGVRVENTAGATGEARALANFKGSPLASVNIITISGQAILVQNNKTNKTTAGGGGGAPTGGETPYVNLYNTIVTRGTTAAKALIEVVKTDLVITGTNLDRSRLVAGAGVAILANMRNDGVATTADDNLGGGVYINGAYIAGVTGAINAWKVRLTDAYNPSVVDGTEDPRGAADQPGENPTYITSSAAAGATITSNQSVIVNNAFASIVNAGGAAGAGNAAVYSLMKDITIWNVDSIRAVAGATALLTAQDGQGVKVYSGKVRSGTGFAINSTGDVLVDKDPFINNVSDKRSNVVVSTAATSNAFSAIYANYPSGGKNVKVGDADVSATASGGASAIYVYKGDVTVQDTLARVYSQSGTAVKVDAGNVTVTAGDVISNPASGNFAAIWVENGDINVGTGGYRNVGAHPRDQGNSRVTSNGALAIYSGGTGEKDVNIGYWGILNITGNVTAGATATTAGGGGLIRAKGRNNVTVSDNAQLLIGYPGSKAFAIEAELGTVLINGGRIKSEDGQAITTYGGDILLNHEVGDDGKVVGPMTEAEEPDWSSRTRITGNRGTLIRAVKGGTLNRAGTVALDGVYWNDTIYNKYGTAVRTDDSVYVYGSVIVWTDTDTAITAGTAANPGLVTLHGGRVWAAGVHSKSNSVAVASKRVYMTGGEVWANTERYSMDNEEMYKDSKATGILIRQGAGEGRLQIEGGDIIAYGASTGIDVRDTAVVAYIGKKVKTTPDNTNATGWPGGRPKNNGRLLYTADQQASTVKVPGAITIKAGNNGVGIKSVGQIKVASDQSFPGEVADNYELSVQVYIGSGNGPNARAIWMPVESGNKQKELNLGQAFVEAGSDGAIAIEGGKRALIKVDHSVILVRHASTGIKGAGGVYVDAGYIEVLATEDNNTGTALTGVELRISGVSDATMDRSEIHSKGIAVLDTRKDTIVQVTGTVHLSGTLGTNTTIGSSVLGDTAYVTMGTEGDSRGTKSRNLWKMSTVSGVTKDLFEQGRALVIPAGVTVSVSDNGSRLETAKSDTIRLSGRITTVGKQAGAKFVNNGKVIVENGGNVLFNKADAESFKNGREEAVIVLKTGSKLDDSLLVHDTGTFSARKYTFLKWARLLSGETADTIKGTLSTRGPGRVIVPPVYATLYGNQSIFVDEDDVEESGASFWSATSSRTDTVYTAKLIKYPLDRRYKPYLDIEEGGSAKGDFYLSGQGTVQLPDEGVRLLTDAGTFSRVAILTNEAGTGTKTYTQTVLRVDVKRIVDQQNVNGPIFFDGFFHNKDGRVDGDPRDTVPVYEGGVRVKYTGNTAKLLDGVKGAVTEWTNDETGLNVAYDGLGVHQFWYRGSLENGTFYPFTSNVPTKVGTYEIWASFAQGRNFEAVAANENSVVKIGTVEIVPGDNESVFGKRESKFELYVDLEAGVPRNNVRVTLPSLDKHDAKYAAELEVNDAAGVVVGNPAIRDRDSVLTFSVNGTSQPGQFVEFTATIEPTVEPGNFEPGQQIVVRARFLSREAMKEALPTYINVDYRNEKLTGLLVGTTYTINGVSLTATRPDTTINPEWIGTTIKVVALKTTEYKFNSDTAKIVIGVRPAVSAALDSIKVDNAATDLSADGRLTGTSTAMEYRLSTEKEWKPAGAVVTSGLKTGTYYIRLAPTTTTFASDSVARTIEKTVSIADANREIPSVNGKTEAAVAPVKVAAASFTAGPSPVSKNGTIKFFSTKQVKSGSLYIFDATGKSVAKVRANSGTGEIAKWNVNNAAEGTYVVKGALVNKNGTKEKVSFVFSVVK